MSRHDGRKAIAVRLPEALRLALIAQTPDWRPLPSLLRGAVLRGLTSPNLAKPLAPATCRPILLQLSRAERQTVAQLGVKLGRSEEEVVLVLAAEALGLL